MNHHNWCCVHAKNLKFIIHLTSSNTLNFDFCRAKTNKMHSLSLLLVGQYQTGGLDDGGKCPYGYIYIVCISSASSTRSVCV